MYVCIYVRMTIINMREKWITGSGISSVELGDQLHTYDRRKDVLQTT